MRVLGQGTLVSVLFGRARGGSASASSHVCLLHAQVNMLERYNALGSHPYIDVWDRDLLGRPGVVGMAIGSIAIGSCRFAMQACESSLCFKVVFRDQQLRIGAVEVQDWFSAEERAGSLRLVLS